jgi:hypothetical protein
MRTPDGLTQCLGCEDYVNDAGERVDIRAKPQVRKKKRFRPQQDDED